MLLTNRTGVKNTRDLLRAFGGLNETYGCTEAEYSGGMNFSARDFPALSTRLPRRRLQELAGLNAAEPAENAPHILGLYVVQQIAAAHGGRAVFGQNTPHGAKAVVYLPLG